MPDETKTTPAAAAPSPEQVAAALKEHDAATDRVRVLIKHPWLVPILNQRSSTPNPKK